MDVAKAVDVVIGEVVMNAPSYTKFPCEFKVKLFRGSPTAGRAIGICNLEINADLAEQHPENLRDTVIHEIAHCLVHLNYDYRCKPHGQEWQDMMYRLGLPPERCHFMEQPNLKRRKHGLHTYHCGCAEHRLTTGKHNKIQIQGRTRKCVQCGEQLNYGPMEQDYG
jgi:SprT protein